MYFNLLTVCLNPFLNAYLWQTQSVMQFGMCMLRSVCACLRFCVRWKSEATSLVTALGKLYIANEWSIGRAQSLFLALGALVRLGENF